MLKESITFIKHSKIPKYDPLPIRKGNCRYVVTGSVSNVGFNTSDLFAAATLVAASTTTLNPIARMAKLTRVEVWSPALTGASVTPGICSIDESVSQSAGGNFDNGFASPRKIIEDSTTSADEPAHIVYTPNRFVFSGAWHNPNTPANSSQLFTLTASAGSVIDIYYAYVENLTVTTSVTGSQYTVVGAVAGQLYKRTWATSRRGKGEMVR